MLIQTVRLRRLPRAVRAPQPGLPAVTALMLWFVLPLTTDTLLVSMACTRRPGG